MATLEKRVETLEQTPAARMAHAKATSDFSQLNDAEFLTILEDARREYPEFFAMIDSASTEDLEASLRRDYGAIQNVELREAMQSAQIFLEVKNANNTKGI